MMTVEEILAEAQPILESMLTPNELQHKAIENPICSMSTWDSGLP